MSAPTWIQRVGERAAGAVIRFDERLVDRADPHPDEPVELSRIPWAAPLSAYLDDIGTELSELLARGIRMPTTTQFAGEDQYVVGEWTTYVMAWYGEWIDETCARMPRTTEALRSIPNLQIGGFTVLGPHTHLERHQGPAKSLRYQMGIEIPEPPGSCGLKVGDTTFLWERGGMVAFDDRSPHEAWNSTDGTRYVLFAQVSWPVAGVAGTVHRGIHKVFGRLLGRYADRARELDAALNPRR